MGTYNLFFNMPGNLVTAMGSLSTYTDMISTMIVAGMAMVNAAILNAYMDGQFGPDFLLNAGGLMALIVSLVSSAYVAVKTVDAAIKFSGAFYAIYAGSSTIGNNLGAWE